jgi:hypothetical protein
LNRGKFGFLEKLDVLVCQTRCSGFQPMHSATICSVEQSLAKPDGPEFLVTQMNQVK